MEKAVALVAGASSGLGRAVARALAADGHTYQPYIQPSAHSCRASFFPICSSISFLSRLFNEKASPATIQTFGGGINTLFVAVTRNA